MALDLNGLRVLVLVGQTHSFTDAAKALELTPSAVSKAISRLEKDVGVRLVHRTTRLVHLTPEGTSFVARCQAVLQEIDEAAAALADSRATPTGRLRTLVPIGFGRQVLVPSLLAFSQRHPGIALDVELSDRMPDVVQEGLDAIVTIGPPADASLVAHRLGRYRMLACASPAYISAHGAPQVPEDLDHHCCLAYAIPHSRQYREWVFTKNGRLHKKSVSGSLNINHAESLMEFAIGGAGIVLLSTFVTAEAVRTGLLVPVLADYASLGPEIHVAYPQARDLSARVRAFKMHLADTVAMSADLQAGAPGMPFNGA